MIVTRALACAGLAMLVYASEATGSPAPEVASNREALLAQAERALSAVDTVTALVLFERAASMGHRADSELGLVRAYMQEGQYRRALSFVAHTTSAHKDDAGGTLLHAWLLALGGQAQLATLRLSEAGARFADDVRIREAASQVESQAPRASGALLAPPARLAPYGPIRGLPPTAAMTGTGTLLGDGLRVVVPLATISPPVAIWVRNAVGQSARATVESRYPELGVAVLRLVAPMRVGTEMPVAVRDPFPGSIAYAGGYPVASVADPAWPVMRAGFVGEPGVNGGKRLTLDSPPGTYGGPVFDRRGAFVGIAMPPGAGNRAGLLPVTKVPKLARARAAVPSESNADVASDEIYERLMLHAVQVIAGAGAAPRAQDAH